MRRASRVAAAVALVLLVLCAIPALAAAACTSTERADRVVAARTVATLRAAGHPGTDDAAGVLARSKRRCATARFARAVATANSRGGAATPGRRIRAAGVDLIGIRSGNGAVWRADLTRMAGRLIVARSERTRRALRAQLRAAGFGAAAIVWSADPTRAAWNAETQSLVAATLARGTAADRVLAGASVRAFGTPARQRAFARLPLVTSVAVAARLHRAARSSAQPGAAQVAARIMARAQARIRGAAQRAWSRTDGHWSTLAEHRQLTTTARAVVRLHPHAATVAAVVRLERALVTPTAVAFAAVPTGVFYPWPRDDAFDRQELSIDVDKPAALQLVVYADGGDPVRSIDQVVEPGGVLLAWDGAASDGRILAAGTYRYAITARDLAGNALTVPGLEEFRIARDTTAPRGR